MFQGVSKEISGMKWVNGLETLSYHAPKLYALLPEEVKQRNTVNLFKSDTKQWICKEWPRRLCKVFVPNLGFI